MRLEEVLIRTKWKYYIKINENINDETIFTHETDARSTDEAKKIAEDILIGFYKMQMYCKNGYSYKDLYAEVVYRTVMEGCEREI